MSATGLPLADMTGCGTFLRLHSPIGWLTTILLKRQATRLKAVPVKYHHRLDQWGIRRVAHQLVVIVAARAAAASDHLAHSATYAFGNDPWSQTGAKRGRRMNNGTLSRLQFRKKVRKSRPPQVWSGLNQRLLARNKLGPISSSRSRRIWKRWGLPLCLWQQSRQLLAHSLALLAQWAIRNTAGSHASMPAARLDATWVHRARIAISANGGAA
mmetsp:Transcript_79867/g.158222  ORF Transcript_79867/g.158222 Transcript_79867/m.158222 type:complete len:213 (-) Transcript_79867:328-966(-)